jgi:hypothetical protein
MAIPTARDINVYDSLDERQACAHFAGKDVAQAEGLFRENSLYYQGDLLWMGAVAFRYYVVAFIRYLQSEFGHGDSDAVNSFYGTITFRLEHGPEDLAPIAAELAKACRYILANWDRFRVLPLYGDLRGAYEGLLRKLERQAVMEFAGFSLWRGAEVKEMADGELRRVGEILEGAGFAGLLPKHKELRVIVQGRVAAGSTVLRAHGLVNEALAANFETLPGFPRAADEALCGEGVVRVAVDCIERYIPGMGPYYDFEGHFLSVLVSLTERRVVDERGEVAGV